MQMPSQEEFVEMTSGSNGQYVNGHDSVHVPGSFEVFFVYMYLVIKMKLLIISFNWRH